MSPDSPSLEQTNDVFNEVGDFQSVKKDQPEMETIACVGTSDDVCNFSENKEVRFSVEFF